MLIKNEARNIDMYSIAADNRLSVGSRLVYIYLRFKTRRSVKYMNISHDIILNELAITVTTLYSYMRELKRFNLLIKEGKVTESIYTLIDKKE